MSTWTAGCLAVFVTGMAVLRIWPRARARWRPWIIQRWARGLGRLAGMRVQIDGSPPATPFFLVSNHLSYVDIILLLSRLETVFVAKQELVDWPVIGYLARLAGTIFVNRQRQRDALRVLTDIDATIARGGAVVVFPEGTSSAGDAVHPLRPALFEWAARTTSPVHVATIRYDVPRGGPPAREAVCWWGEMSFLPHLIGLLRLPRFTATLRFAPEPLASADRSELARRARAVMAAGLIPGGATRETA